MTARPGTPLGEQPLQDPKRCLKVLCMVRFANPSRDVRCAGGREVVLRSMQGLALYPCNSIFTNGYLTTGGNADGLQKLYLFALSVTRLATSNGAWVDTFCADYMPNVPGTTSPPEGV